MLRGIPGVLSPELLKTLAEMGHGDTIVIGDAYYPSAASGRYNKLIRADGVPATALIDAILQVMPLDSNYTEHPFLIMDAMEQDKGIVKTNWDAYIEVVEKWEPKGKACVGFIDRFDFYEEAKKAYAVVASGETAPYGCIIIKKGSI